ARLVTVSIDLALLRKHHVAIQEALDLCLQKLSSADLESSSRQFVLSEGDLAAFVLDRAAAEQKRQLRYPGRPTLRSQNFRSTATSSRHLESAIPQTRIISKRQPQTDLYISLTRCSRNLAEVTRVEIGNRITKMRRVG